MIQLKSIRLSNLGPIDDLVVEVRSHNQLPVPIVLVGQNGAGKSLFLSTILDAITEARRLSFRKIPEVDGTDYIRLSQKTYVKVGAAFSHAHIEFSTDAGTMAFDEVVSRATWEDFQKQYPAISAISGLAQSEFPKSGFFKHVTLPDAAQATIRSHSFLYFPFFRYELPSWFSATARVELAKSDNFWGSAKINPVRSNVLASSAGWILDLILDRELYERVVIPGDRHGDARIGYVGPNNTILNTLNSVLTAMMKAKDTTIEYARIGISPKGSRAVAIRAKKTGGGEYLVASDLAAISSGEAMCLGMAAEIIRGHELASGAPPHELSSVRGLVLVDEIDLHLHIDYQRKVLPTIVRMFPSVQFVITTHSPYFLLGMAETGEVDIFNLPIGNLILPSEFREFQAAYDTFIAENDRFKELYEKLHAVSAGSREVPLIITEGKTDWQHLKMALGRLSTGDNPVQIQVEFLEFGDDASMNDTKLSQMCEHFATIPQTRRMIFIFDRDNPAVVHKMSGEPGSFRSLGNNVYSMCIPRPAHREKNDRISIEFYYSDEVISTRDDAGRRLWFTNEIIAERNLTTKANVYRALEVPIAEDEAQKSIYDQDASKIVDASGASVGLSKTAFLDVILAKDVVASTVDWDAFRPLFKVVSDIVDIE